MEINTEVYGTTGLPQFGPAAVAVTGPANIEKLNTLFNAFIKGVAALGIEGNDLPAHGFGLFMTSAYGCATQWVGGKPVIGNV